MNGDRLPRVSVLALQGGVAEHLAMLRRPGAECVEVRLPIHLEGLDGILPGEESTVIGSLLAEYGPMEPLRRLRAGLRHLRRHDPARPGPRRRAAADSRRDGHRGAAQRLRPQLDSFERDLAVAGLEGGPFRAVFIRAPAIERLGAGVETLAALADGTPVAARQGRLLASAFHPELGEDARIHRMFLELCRAGRP